MPSCPVCKSPSAPLSQNPSFPFCRERCKLVDLGRWFGEGYRIAGKPEEEEDALRPGPSDAAHDDGES